jgi:hypothetical protein
MLGGRTVSWMKPPTFRNGVCGTHFAAFWTARMRSSVATVLRAAFRDVAWSTLPHRPTTQRCTAVVTQHLFHRMLEALPIGVIVFPCTGIQDNLADKATRLGIPVGRFTKDDPAQASSCLPISPTLNAHYRAAGDDTRACRTRWIMRACLLLIRPGSRSRQRRCHRRCRRRA